MEVNEELQSQLVAFQRNEITEHHIYQQLAKTIPSQANREILEKIAADELKHYQALKRFSGKEVQPNRLMFWFYYLVSRLLGFTFGIKLMEMGEKKAEKNYAGLEGKLEVVSHIMRDEDAHEAALIGMLDEESLRYAGSVVLGLSDALVELTGALAGLTLALQNARLIALTGLITGIAASLSMAASEYLSTRSELTDKHPLKAALYTGIAYVITVTLLILPYLLLDNYYLSLATTLTIVVMIIAAFNFYISVAKEEPFQKRFIEMAALSLGIAGLSFFIGYLVRSTLGVEI